MKNQKTQATVGSRHRTKTRTEEKNQHRKLKRWSTTGGVARDRQFLFLIRHASCYLYSSAENENTEKNYVTGKLSTDIKDTVNDFVMMTA